jgi:hypothetical protein
MVFIIQRLNQKGVRCRRYIYTTQNNLLIPLYDSIPLETFTTFQKRI